MRFNYKILVKPASKLAGKSNTKIESVNNDKKADLSNASNLIDKKAGSTPNLGVLKRRSFLQSLIGTATAVSIPKAVKAVQKSLGFRFLRPPGSLSERDFVDRCIRCNQCSEVCPNDCIRFMGLQNGISSWGTPYIIPREQACILCMKCGEACPTGAITKVEDTIGQILTHVKMGKAVVDKDHCLSYQGKTCGVCYRACLLADVSITIGFLEQPSVTDQCVGCGLCERSCIQLPQAIRVIPLPS